MVIIYGANNDSNDVCIEIAILYIYKIIQIHNWEFSILHVYTYDRNPVENELMYICVLQYNIFFG